MHGVVDQSAGASKFTMAHVAHRECLSANASWKKLVGVERVVGVLHFWHIYVGNVQKGTRASTLWKDSVCCVSE